MTGSIARFFAISPGEEKKTALLYSLYFVFFLGQSWGALAALTLFLDNWPAEDLALMFIGSAIITLVVGLAYSSFADRVSNLHLLWAIYLFIGLWLLSVRVLLFTNGGQSGLAYPYYYLLYDLVRDLSVLHMTAYTIGFYNARSAKRAMPVVLSAGLAGNTIAGFTVAYIGARIGLENIVLLWLATLLLAVIVVVILEHSFGQRGDKRGTTQPGLAAEPPKETGGDSWRNLKEGFSYVKSSALLRWLALAAFGMVMLMNVLTFQSSQIFQVYYAGNPEDMLRFFGLFAGFSNLFGVLIQSLWIGRLITAVGVGSANLIFPSLTMVSVLLLGTFPSYLTAIFGRLTHITFRRAIQAPVDAILYNCLRSSIRGRSRAFIHAMVVPLGALAGGLLLLVVRQGWLTATQLSVIAVAIACIYYLAMLRVRSEYGLAFSQLMADGEVAFLRSGEDAFQHPDPNAIAALTERLETSDSAEMTVFLSEMLYELQGATAFPRLRQVAEEKGPVVQAELISLLGEEWITHPTVRAMALQGLQNDEPQVVTASAFVLAAAPGSASDGEMLTAFAKLAGSPSDEVRAAVIPALLRAADESLEKTAYDAMSDWLSANASDRERLLALRVLAQAGDEMLLERLKPYLTDPAPSVRAQAVRVIGGLPQRTDDEEISATAIALLLPFLLDEAEAVQLATIRQIGTLQNAVTGSALWPFLGDPRIRIRRAAVDAFPPSMEKELLAAIVGTDPLIAESAAFILTRSLGIRRHGHHIVDFLSERIGDMYALKSHLAAIEIYRTPPGRLIQAALHDQVKSTVDDMFWLLGALCGQAEARSIQRSLRSPNEQTRSNGAEALESLTTPRIARDLLPLSAPDYWQLAKDDSVSSASNLDATQVLRFAWPELDCGGTSPPLLRRNLATFYDSDWLKAIAIQVALAEHRQTPGVDLLAAGDHLIPDRALQQALQATDARGATVLYETIDWAMAQIGSTESKGSDMLTIIEKVLFLKEVPFFEDMTIDQLRVLATISGEVEYGKNEHIVHQGEHGNTLYVVAQGKVAIQSATTSGHRTSIRRLATLGPREYFGEMSIFDSQPYGSDVVTIEPTILLQVRQEPMLNLIELQPDLSLSLLRVFSLRLRHFMQMAEESKESKSKELTDIYDTLGL